MPSTTTKTTSCPVCGGPVEQRATGRPARYCSTRCRQTANRAKHNAQAAATRAGWLRAELERQAQALRQAAFALHQILEPERQAAGRSVDAAVAAGELDWQAATPRGWEAEAAELAQVAARIGDRAARYAVEHARTGAEHRRALATAGIRLIEASPPAADETPAPNAVANAEAAVRDDVFDAVEDLLGVTDPTTAIGSRLPDPLADALERPVAELVERFGAQSGDGPLDQLAAAAAAVLAAAEPHRADWPGALAGAHQAATTAVTTYQQH